MKSIEEQINETLVALEQHQLQVTALQARLVMLNRQQVESRRGVLAAETLQSHSQLLQE